MDDGSGHTSRRGRRVRQAVVRGIEAAAGWLIRRLGERPSSHLSEAQLRVLVAHNTVIDRDERQLIDDVLAVGSRHVRELMVPRTEVVFLDADTPIVEAARVAGQTRHSRFPVMTADRDDVVGFVHLRDLLVHPTTDPRTTVGQVARELRRLPGSKRVLAALSEMRRAGDQVALVVDEYGGTAGLITLEDLIEELVGEIHDEYDAAPEAAVPEGTAPSDVDGRLNLADFAERVGFPLLPGPYDTVAGYVMAVLGRLPAVGDEVVVDVADGRWRLTVSEMDRRRVARVALAFVRDEPIPAPAVSIENLPALAPVSAG